MNVVLFYGVHLTGLSYPFSEVDKYTDENSPYIHVFGGGNNDGGAFAGIELTTLADDYSVESVTVEQLLVKAASASAKAKQADFDAWWEAEGKAEFGEEADGAPSLRIVMDSD